MIPNTSNPNNRDLNKEIARLTREYDEMLDNNTEVRSNPTKLKAATEELTQRVEALKRLALLQESQENSLNEEVAVPKDQVSIYDTASGPRIQKYQPGIDFQAVFDKLTQVFTEAISSLLNFLGISDELKKDTKKLQEGLGRLEIEQTIDASNKAMNQYTGFSVGEGKAGSLLTVPKELFVEPKKMKEHKSEFIHKTTAELALKKKAYLAVPDFNVAGFDVKLVPKSFDNQGIVDGQVTPTSYILGKPKDDLEVQEEVYVWDGSDIKRTSRRPEEHLANVYVLDLGPKQAVIRTGVIDTEAKKDDFVKIIKEIHSAHKDEYKTTTGKDLQLRVVSQQLNSFEAESRMIQDQHYMIAEANKDLKGVAEVIHINVPSNRWYHVTKWVDSLGMIGKILKFIAPMNFLNGERLSKKLNLSSMGTYLNWVTDDVSRLGSVNEKYKALTDQLSKNKELRIEYKKRIDSAVIEISKLRNMPRTEENRNELEAQQKNLRDNRKILKIVLTEDYNLLERIEDYYEEGEIIFSDPEVEVVEANEPEESLRVEQDIQKISLMRQVLGAQLGIKKQTLDRGQEGMAIQMLNDRLGIVSAMNCKSGLDRTGIWHAIKLGMLSFEKKLEVQDGSTRAFNLVNDWEGISSLVNRINASNPRWHAGDIIKLIDRNELLKQLELPENTTDKELAMIQGKIRDVLSFRNEVLNNLITIGIPITTASTGVMGLKWNTGQEENLIPLNFLPSHVKTVREVEVKKQTPEGEVTEKIMIEKLIPLVKYNSAGEPVGITNEGAQLLTKHQKLRGS